MIQKHKFVEKNLDLLRTLTHNGYVSPKLINYYNIYKLYMSTKDSSKMRRYDIVAREMRSSVPTVRLAISDMKKYVKK